MDNDIDLKKLGLKHARQSEKLDVLVKRGMKCVEIATEGKFIITMAVRYKGGQTKAFYKADTLCQALDDAYEVHGD